MMMTRKVLGKWRRIIYDYVLWKCGIADSEVEGKIGVNWLRFEMGSYV